MNNANPYAAPHSHSHTFASPAPHAPGGEYEFNEYENAVFRRLAGAMTFVAIALLVYGPVSLGLGALAIANGNLIVAIAQLLQGATSALIGALLLRAARAFSRVVHTRGADIQHLIEGLGELCRVFAVQRVLMALSLAVQAGALFVLFFALAAR